MGDFSDNFIALDDDFFGDGATDANTEPLDPYLEHSIDSSTRHLTRRRNYATLALSGSARRRHAPFQWEAIGYWRYKIDNSVDTIRVSVSGVVWSVPAEEGTTTADIDVRMRLLGAGAKSTAVWTGDGTDQNYTIELDVSDLGLRGTTWLLLEVQGQDEGAKETLSNGDFSPSYDGLKEDNTNGLSGLTEATYLVDGSRALQAFANDVSTLGYGSSLTTSNTYVPISNVSGSWRADIDGSTDSEVRHLSYIEPKAIHLNAVVDDNRPHNSYRPKSAVTMRAREDVQGLHTSRHRVNINNLYTRGELKMLGPTPRLAGGSNWPSNQYARWSTIYGDGSKTQRITTMPWKVDRDTSTITLEMAMLFYGVVQASGSVRSIETAQTLASQWDWNITARLQQRQGTSEVTLATQSEQVDADHIAAYWGIDAVPLLQQVWYHYFHQAGDQDDDYTYNEGRLVQQDLSVVTPVAITISVDGTSVDWDLPTWIDLDMGPGDTADIEWGVNAIDQEPGKLCCKVLSISGFERGTG